MTSNRGTTRHPFLIKTLILFLVAVLSVAPMSLAIVSDTAYAAGIEGVGSNNSTPNNTLLNKMLENTVNNTLGSTNNNNSNNNNNNDNATQAAPKSESLSKVSTNKAPLKRVADDKPKNGSKKKTGSSTDSPFDFGGVIGQLQIVVTAFLLPAAIIISGWKILYLAVFVGLIGFDPLHMMADDSAAPQSFGAVTGEIKRHCVSFVKGLCWIGSIFIIFQLVLVAASTIAGAFKTAFD